MTAEERAAALKVKYFGNGVCDTSHGTFKKFGQELSMPAATVLDCIRAGAGVIRSEDFDAIPWTAEEKTNRHSRKGPAYFARHQSALTAMRRLEKELSEVKEMTNVEPSPQ